MTVSLGDVIIKKLKDGSNSNMMVDGSESNRLFRYKVPTGKSLELCTVNGYVSSRTSGATKTPNANRMHLFGSIAAMENGFQFYVRDDTNATKLNFTDDCPIKTTADLALLSTLRGVECGDYLSTTPWINDGFRFDFDMIASFGGPLLLLSGYEIIWRVRDDLLGTKHFDKMEVAVKGTLADVL